MPAAFFAIAFLAIMVVPHVSAKLNTFRGAEFFFKAGNTEPACLPSGVCFVFRSSGQIDRQPSGYRVPLQIRGIDDLFQLASLIDSEALTVGTGDGAADGQMVLIVPRYRNYTNADETTRQIPATLEFKEVPNGLISIFFQQQGHATPPRTLELRRNTDVPGLWAQAGAAKAIVALIVALLVITSLIEGRSAASSGLARLEFAFLTVLRLLAVATAKDALAPIPFTFFVGIILLPWLWLLTLLQRYLAGRSSTFRHFLDRVEYRFDRMAHRPPVAFQPIATFMALALTVGLFGYCLWFSDSFRWSMFEERDFLEASQLAGSWTFPVYGPQLLAGGATPGGILYPLLVPVVALWPDPHVLHFLNQILFLSIPVIVWWTLHTRDPAGALFAAFAVAASQTVIALSYWPIHPNFSLAVAFFYAHAIIRGSVDGHKGWLIVSGLLLGVLTQLHFSYFLLVPAHIALAVFGNLRNAFLKTICILAVFVPLVPYLVVEVLQDFPNTRQIMTMPRFHPEYVLSLPMANTNVIVLTLEWLRQFPGLLAEPISRFVVGMVGVGIASAIFAAAGRINGAARITLPAAAAALFCIPLLGLTLMGMGYGSRHTISILPGMFLLAGIGFGTATRLLLGSWQRTSAFILLLLVAIFGWRITDSDRIAVVTRQQGEWAVDYRQRETIANDLITRLGVTPEIYQARVFWWWLGWSMAPEVFGDLYRKRRGEGRLPSRVIAPDDYILITDRDPPPFLKNAFELKDTRPVGGMYVHQAKATEKFRQPLPSSNADTGTRLHPFLRAVDLLRHRQAEFGRIGQQQDGAVQRELFLGILAEGRLKILVTTEEHQIDNRSRLRWCVDSPSLNGHYQEIKTVWRPRLLLESATGSTQISLARDVLGSLLYKTPQCGEAWSEKSGSQSIAFAADGIFDQSFMLRPDLSARTWKLGDLPPTVHALDRDAISNWMTTRFKPDRLPE